MSRRLVDRLVSFVHSAPALPPAARLFSPSAAECTDAIWPLVARRNLKRFAAVAVRFSARDEARYAPLLELVASLDDAALVDLFTGPELTSWIAGAETAGPEEAPTFGGWLGTFLLPVALAHGRELPRIAVTTSAETHLELVSIRRRVWLPAPKDTVTCEVRGGTLIVDGTVDPPTIPIPALDGRIAVSGAPNRWLDHAFPDRDQVADCDLDRLSALTDRLEAAVADLVRVWPEAWDEVRAIVRWIVPLTPDDSFYVPGFRGLVALGEHDPYPLSCRLFHESSHNKLSSVLELASASTNPDEPVFSPFARGKGPVTSLLQSSWSFAREFELLKRLEANGLFDPASMRKLEVKFRVFLDKGLPSLRKTARLTPLGDAVVATIEESIR